MEHKTVFDLQTGMSPGGIPGCPLPIETQMKINALIDDLYGLGVIPVKIVLGGVNRQKYIHSYETGYSEAVDPPPRVKGHRREWVSIEFEAEEKDRDCGPHGDIWP